MSTTITPISKRDNEMFRSAIFASNALKNLEKLKEKLKNAYLDNPGDITNALGFGIFSIVPSQVDDPVEQKESLEDAIDAFEKILEKDPNHWLSLYYKNKLKSLFSSYYGEEEEIIAGIKELIDRQNQSEHRPYFVLPYILMVDILLTGSSADKDGALEFLTKAENLPREAVKDHYLLGFLFMELDKKLRMSGEDDLAERVIRLGHEYFPDIM